jgi:ketosteroid isomerase-like protein
MMLILALMFIVLMMPVFGGVVRAQEISSGLATFSESDALNMAQEWASLVSQANVAELEKLLNDQYMHIHATALVESKAQFLEAFKNGSRKYDLIKIEEINVRIFGSSAVVTGKFNLKAFVRGKTIEGVNRFGLVLVKTQNGQQIVSFQATSIPQQQ